jgi:capsular exopolysaccharide synthesis family protein
MNELEKYDGKVIGQEIVNFDIPSETDNEAPNFILGVLRRWHILLLTFFMICALGLPAIWFLIKPVYVVTGAIRIAPILADILTEEKDRGDISDYQSFMNTQVQMITSSQVIQRVADELQDKHLSIFEKQSLTSKLKQKLLKRTQIKKPELSWVLKQAIINGAISVSAPRANELIEITMFAENDDEAKLVVDAFIRAYKAVGVSNSTQDEDRNLSILENERNVKAEEMENLRQQIYRLAQEYGTDKLAGRQDMMLRRVSSLQKTLTELEAARMNLESQIQLLERKFEDPIPPDELLKMRQEYINRDTSVDILEQNIAHMEQNLLLAENTLTPTNDELELQQEILEETKKRLEESKEAASIEFDEMLTEEVSKSSEAKLISLRAALEHTRIYEQNLRNMINQEDDNTIELGRLQLDIQDVQNKLDMTTKRYEEILERIQDLEMQRKRPARISVHYNADIASIRDKRRKLTFGLCIAALACGMWFAYLRDKADKRLWAPEDAAKRIGIKIIGTTTSLHAVKPSLLPDQIIEDYQTIRANLELSSGEGIPRILVVTSPGMKEGKTTFSVNLATSLAEAGKRVLLIDGDLRKPDVARLLNLPKDLMGLHDVLNGIQIERAVYSMASTGLDVLAADFYDPADGYELLALPSTAGRIKKISQKYDHVIVDTPPALSFPDALMWAKIGNAVVLTSFAGQTTFPELREAKERLINVDVKVLGAVVTSVEAEHSYYRHSPAYYAQRSRARRVKRKTLLSYDN